jgi:hypothetical protein
VPNGAEIIISADAPLDGEIGMQIDQLTGRVSLVDGQPQHGAGLAFMTFEGAAVGHTGATTELRAVEVGNLPNVKVHGAAGSAEGKALSRSSPLARPWGAGRWVRSSMRWALGGGLIVRAPAQHGMPLFIGPNRLSRVMSNCAMREAAFGGITAADRAI